MFAELSGEQRVALPLGQCGRSSSVNSISLRVLSCPDEISKARKRWVDSGHGDRASMHQSRGIRQPRAHSIAELILSNNYASSFMQLGVQVLIELDLHQTLRVHYKQWHFEIPYSFHMFIPAPFGGGCEHSVSAIASVMICVIVFDVTLGRFYVCNVMIPIIDPRHLIDMLVSYDHSISTLERAIETNEFAIVMPASIFTQFILVLFAVYVCCLMPCGSSSNCF